MYLRFTSICFLHPVLYGIDAHQGSLWELKRGVWGRQVS